MAGKQVPRDRYSWEHTFDATLLETDLALLPTRIESARKAISSRMRQIDSREHPAEVRAAKMALNVLAVLERVQLKSAS